MFPLTSQRTQQWDMLKPMGDVLLVYGVLLNLVPVAVVPPLIRLLELWRLLLPRCLRRRRLLYCIFLKIWMAGTRNFGSYQLWFKF